MLEYNTGDVPRSTAALKRGFDVVVAGAMLLVLAPVLAAVALAIKLDDRGPVLFRQLRAGRNGKPFTIIKFRSMDVDAEEHLRHLVDLNALPAPIFKLRWDPRVTGVGRILRRFSLDELPQLINVIRGEMSLVGPRPEMVSITDRYKPEHRFRLAVKPGITGPMQVFGRGELTFDERLAVRSTTSRTCPSRVISGFWYRRFRRRLGAPGRSRPHETQTVTGRSASAWSFHSRPAPTSGRATYAPPASIGTGKLGSSAKSPTWRTASAVPPGLTKLRREQQSQSRPAR